MNKISSQHATAVPSELYKPMICAVLVLILAAGLSGCSYMVSSATGNMTAGLSDAILDNDDLETVKDGLPAYLLMIDGLVNANPKDSKLLQTAASLNTAYVGLFVKDVSRSKKLTDKALDYSFRAVCNRRPEICATRDLRYKVFADAVQKTDLKDVPALYSLGSAWASWIQAHSDDVNAVAKLSKVEEVMHRVVELDESYEKGGAHIYLGALSTLLPPALGGRPEVGRNHFERAIDLSGGENLMAYVVFAERYARLMFDRELHDGLLEHVVAADPDAPGFTLMNTVAQKRARQLLDSADDYF
jgi:hypothetical protein